MRRIINHHPGRGGRLFLGLLPFAVGLAIYLLASGARLDADAGDKLMPSVSAMGSAMGRLMFQRDAAVGQAILVYDTWQSLARLGTGLAVSTLIGLVCGILIGFIPYARAAFEPFLAALSLVPPLAVLPILFIVFGLGELSKAVLIVFGIAPYITRDVVLRVGQIPREQIVKAQTLGASTWQMLLGVVLPQVLPRLIDSVRLSLGAAWLYVIAAEAITANGGLGYRIFLVRRYLAMDVILPYVVWITVLAFLMDAALRLLAVRAFPWAGLKEG